MRVSNHDAMPDLCRITWKQTRDRETLCRVVLLASIIGSSQRLRPDVTENEAIGILDEMVHNKRFLSSLGTHGREINQKLVKPLKGSLSSTVRSWKGRGGSHIGSVRVESWLNDMNEFLRKIGFDLVGWLQEFDCPAEAASEIANELLGSRRGASRFTTWVSHPLVLPARVPPPIKKWYPRHRICYQPRVNEDVVKFMLRTGAITIRSSEEYHPRPESGFDDMEDFYVPSPLIFYAPSYDHIMQYSNDPGLAGESISRFTATDSGVCKDVDPNCLACPLKTICQLSITRGKDPSVIRGHPRRNFVFMNSPKPKIAQECRIR